MGSEWKQTTIGEEATLQRGFDITRKEQSHGKVPVVSSGGISSYHNVAKQSGPGVVMGRKGSLGTVFFLEEEYWPHDTTLWVKDFHGNDERFVYYFFKDLADHLLSMDVGAANPTLNRNHVHPMEISWPPLSEQKAIAHILGTLDDKIELNRRMNATLEGMAQALFKSWFVDFDPVIDNALAAGNPIPDELAPRACLRASHRQAEVRRHLSAEASAKVEALSAQKTATTQQGSFDDSTLSDRKSHFPAAFQFTEELGWIPEGWDVVRFDELVSAKQGRYLAKTDMVETADPVFKHPVWGGNGILGFSSSYAYDEPITLMTCRGSNCGLIKFTESSAWISNNSFACPTNYGSQYFLYLYFRNESFEECVSGSAQPQITYTALKNKVMKFPISGPICELFSNLVQNYKDRQVQNGSQNETLTKLRDTLLPKLISGELSVKQADQLLKNSP